MPAETNADEIKQQLAEIERERVKAAETALIELCKELDFSIVPIVQIVPGEAPSATLMVRLNK